MLRPVNKLGIDAGHYSVKSVAGIWKNSAHFSGKIGNICARNNENDDLTVSALHQSIKPVYGKCTAVFTAVGLSDTILREIDVPAELGDYEVEGAIEIELGDTLPFSLDQVYFDYCEVIPSDFDSFPQDKSRYLVAASRKDAVDRLTAEIQSFDKKKLSISVDVDAYAYSRLVNLLYSSELDSKVILLVDVGHQNTRFYFYDDQGLIFHRDQQTGGKLVTESIAEIYDLDQDASEKLKHLPEHDDDFYELVLTPFVQSFMEQIGLALDFFEASRKSEKSVGKIVFTGGGICLDGFYKALESRLDHKSEIIDLSVVLSNELMKDRDFLSFSANYALALALLLVGVEK